MNRLPRRIIPGLVGRYLGRLRFPVLFLLTALLFAVNVFVPDPIPFVDEIILALVGLMLGSLRDRGGDSDDGRETDRIAGERDGDRRDVDE